LLLTESMSRSPSVRPQSATGVSCACPSSNCDPIGASFSRGIPPNRGSVSRKTAHRRRHTIAIPGNDFCSTNNLVIRTGGAQPHRHNWTTTCPAESRGNRARPARQQESVTQLEPTNGASLQPGKQGMPESPGFAQKSYGNPHTPRPTYCECLSH